MTITFYILFFVPYSSYSSLALASQNVIIFLNLEKYTNCNKEIVNDNF
jgi:hypothetical protein